MSSDLEEARGARRFEDWSLRQKLIAKWSSVDDLNGSVAISVNEVNGCAPSPRLGPRIGGGWRKCFKRDISTQRGELRPFRKELAEIRGAENDLKRSKSGHPNGACGIPERRTVSFVGDSGKLAGQDGLHGKHFQAG